MDRRMYGEYDNYHYRSVDEMTLEEQIASTKKALESAIRLSQTYKNEYLERIIIDIKQRLQELEALE